MKRLVHPLLALLCLSTATTFAQPLAIFARDDARRTDAATAPADADQAAFWSAYRRDRADTVVLEAELPLVSPPAWGKTIGPRTGGLLRYHRQFPHGFVCRLSLHDLQPNHAYVLTLNGNPEKAGNRLLRTPVPGNDAEKYYDFLDIKTDAQGAYDVDLGIFLASGAYDVRLYVKDTADFKIVLYRDFFPFTVD